MDDLLYSVNPATGETVGSVPVTPVDGVPRIVDRARASFGEWSGLSHADRRTHLRSFTRAVLDRGDEIAAVVASETGKHGDDAYAYDVLTALTVMDHYTRNAARYLRSQRARSWPFVTTRGWTEFHPRGVAGVITPWNYPFFLPMVSTVTALAAGCTVVLKPSEVTPLSGRLLGEIAADAGLPPDAVQVIHGAGDVGKALIESGVDVVSFTGSTAVGKLVATEAASRLVPAVLELGGNDAMVVLGDADLGRAARTAVWAAMVNAGQTCVSVERCYVVDAVYDEFLAEVERRFDGVGAGDGSASDVGPIIHPPQADIIEAHLRDAVDKGARVLRGGHRIDRPDGGIFFEPTLLVDVDRSMRLMQDETFGPILPIMRVADAEEALAAANDTRFGLHGSVWTRDRGLARRFASRFQSGTVALNDVAVNFITPGMAFGGIGDSGFGSTFGAEGIRAYCAPRSVASSRLRIPTSSLLGASFPRRRPRWYWRALARFLYRW